MQKESINQNIDFGNYIKLFRNLLRRPGSHKYSIFYFRYKDVNGIFILIFLSQDLEFYFKYFNRNIANEKRI